MLGRTEPTENALGVDRVALCLEDDVQGVDGEQGRRGRNSQSCAALACLGGQAGWGWRRCLLEKWEERTAELRRGWGEEEEPGFFWNFHLMRMLCDWLMISFGGLILNVLNQDWWCFQHLVQRRFPFPWRAFSQFHFLPFELWFLDFASPFSSFCPAVKSLHPSSYFRQLHLALPLILLLHASPSSLRPLGFPDNSLQQKLLILGQKSMMQLLDSVQPDLPARCLRAPIASSLRTQQTR